MRSRWRSWCWNWTRSLTSRATTTTAGVPSKSMGAATASVVAVRRRLACASGARTARSSRWPRACHQTARDGRPLVDVKEVDERLERRSRRPTTGRARGRPWGSRRRRCPRDGRRRAPATPRGGCGSSPGPGEARPRSGRPQERSHSRSAGWDCSSVVGGRPSGGPGAEVAGGRRIRGPLRKSRGQPYGGGNLAVELRKPAERGRSCRARRRGRACDMWRKGSCCGKACPKG